MPSTSRVDSALPLNSIAQRCAEESDRYFRRQPFDPQYCFELFRLALGEGNPQAWEAVFAQYRGLVSAWVTRHPEIRRAGGEVQEYVNRAFERMWAALPAERFARLRDLSAVLAYLKMCVHSAIVEDLRRARPAMRDVSLDDSPETAGAESIRATASPVERAVIAREERDRLWNAVDHRLQDARERLVVHCLFELGLKPRAILAQHPDQFRDVREVYVVRQVVLERLSRDPAVQELVGGRA